MAYLHLTAQRLGAALRCNLHVTPIVFVGSIATMFTVVGGCHRDRERSSPVTELPPTSSNTRDASVRDRNMILITLGQDETKLNGASVGALRPQSDGELYLHPLADAIRALPKPPDNELRSARVEIPADSVYLDLVRVFFTAGQTEIQNFQLVLIDDGRTFHAEKSDYSPPEPLVVVTSPDGCAKLEVRPSPKLIVTSSATQRWLIGTVTFDERWSRVNVPRCAPPPAVISSNRVYASAFRPTHFSIDCATVFENNTAAHASCDEGRKTHIGDKSVFLGGRAGCAVGPLPKGNDTSVWAGDLASSINAIGLTGSEVAFGASMQEKNVYLLPVFEALNHRASVSFFLPKPDDITATPPSCDRAVRTLDELKVAAARWLGAMPIKSR